MEAPVTYDEALKAMAKAIDDEHWLARDWGGQISEDAARAAANAIGLHKLLERLAELEELRDEMEQIGIERNLRS
jgi:hypothetical protein